MKEIFFHYSEFKGDLEALQAGDDVEFTIKERNVSWVVGLDTSLLNFLETFVRYARYLGQNCSFLSGLHFRMKHCHFNRAGKILYTLIILRCNCLHLQ